MWEYKNTDELYHYGVLGMKWGHRKDSYSSTSLRSYIARKKNEKVDKSFKKWNENSKKKQNAITLGKKANIARISYEKNKANKSLKSEYKNIDKAYKKALRGNTTYRKGQIKNEVGSDMSRKYLSEAKKIKKQLSNNSENKSLQKQYNSLMSKHDIERAKARKAVSVAQSRSQLKANIKRTATKTVKAAAIGGAVAGGVYLTNKYLTNHEVTLNGKAVKVGKETISKVSDLVKKGKKISRYIY